MILYCKIYVPDGLFEEFLQFFRKTVADFEKRKGIVSKGFDNPEEFHVMMAADMRSATMEEIEAKLKPVLPYLQKFPRT